MRIDYVGVLVQYTLGDLIRDLERVVEYKSDHHVYFDFGDSPMERDPFGSWRGSLHLTSPRIRKARGWLNTLLVVPERVAAVAGLASGK